MDLVPAAVGLTDAELVTLAVAQAVLGFHCEARWLRFAHAHLHGMFPYLPQRPAYNKRLRAALPLVKRAIRSLAADTDLWLDDVWIVDSTPVECARSRETVKRSDLAGWANYGYCRSHSRFYWGLKLHLVCTPASLEEEFVRIYPEGSESSVSARRCSSELLPHHLYSPFRPRGSKLLRATGLWS
ncbi:hypothetical protein HNR72_005263 [Streptomyces collinus]|uniref:Transposase IS4 family protein n=1 Tax=Streptomyces collinus TaxID=42684 RepID=A0AA89QED9_STRCU|nr:hypothetical protein [Streptomyces collinus]